MSNHPIWPFRRGRGNIQPDTIADVKSLIDTYGKELTPRQLIVVIMRHGLDTSNPQTLQEVATFMGITPQRVSQLEKRALTILRSYENGTPVKKRGRPPGSGQDSTSQNIF